MTDPSLYMERKCPTVGGSKYLCKVIGKCDCGQDDDLYAAYERQCAWRAKRLPKLLKDAT